MPEAEISPTGTVTVEGHNVGELQGFRFTADTSGNGEDAKAVKTAAQKALGAEFEARAERFSICANGDIALGSDGTLRWIGAPIGTLTSSEDPLKPRVILFADEQLTGPARDKVQARADRFVAYQIETVLKPLIDLKTADQLTGIARGIAFRLIENYGVIDRREIAEDVKSLPQDGRGALRRLGVRFGAYHLFIPVLLKPAPASLVTLLWALVNDGKDKPGFGDIVHLLASGRTSVVVNQSFDAVFYKLAGFRILGRRAVRVDILERLADIIRPALAWRADQGTRPDGAYDGAAFMVTPPMMSILGANADDMEEILKGLGYRGEPKAAADVEAKLATLDRAIADAAEKAAAEKQAKAEAEAAAAAAASETGEAVAAEDSEEAAPVVAESAEAPATDAETEAAISDGHADEEIVAADEAVEPADAEQTEAPVEAATWAPDVTEVPAIEVPAPVEVAAEPVAEEAAAPAESVPAEAAEPPKPIMLWRPQRAEGRPRHQHGRGRDQNRGRGQQGRAEGAEGQPREQRQGRPEGRPDNRRHQGKPVEGQGERKPQPWKGRDGNRPEGQGRPDHKGGGRPDRRDGGKPNNYQGKPREEKPVKIDPNSPFTKLAALRDQLKK